MGVEKECRNIIESPFLIACQIYVIIGPSESLSKIAKEHKDTGVNYQC